MVEEKLNKILIGEGFNEAIDELSKINFSIPLIPSEIKIDMQNIIYPNNGMLVTNVEEIGTFNLNPKNGVDLINAGAKIFAYDESINKFQGLEGTGYLTSHSIVMLGKDDYKPINLITLYFYTRSKDICLGNKYIKYSEDPDMDSKKDYVRDKLKVLLDNVPPNTILFIDGPLIGGDVYTTVIGRIKSFNKNNIIPIFFVKNSNSNLVIENIPELMGKYNSDMHWSFRLLKKGQRTNFFKYVDRVNSENAKIFCYLKAFNISPQRIEFHIDTFNQFKDQIPQLMDLIYYFMLVQGDEKNPQIRPIAIAEKFARETLHIFNLDKIMKSTGIVPTMNQDRFAW